jgi:DNA-binding CsgD family transcriptional regulator
LEQALALARMLGNSEAELKILLDLGLLAEMQGNDVEATRWFKRTLAGQRAAGNVRGVLVALTNLGEAAYRQGDMEASRRMSEEALHLVRPIVDPEMECLIHGNWGQVDLHDGQPVSAWAHFAEGLRLARIARNDLLLADVMIGMSGVALAAGRVTDAAMLLGVSESWCARFGSQMVPHHGLRRRLLQQLEQALSPADLNDALAQGRQRDDDRVFALVSSIDPATVKPHPPGISELTPRELTVLHLLVEGASDKAIAQALYISPRTAMRHVGSILKKLGTNNRAAAAARAREWNLVQPHHARTPHHCVVVGPAVSNPTATPGVASASARR